MSQLRGRAPGDLMVDVTSRGCGLQVPVTRTGTDAGPSPVPWVSSERLRTGTRTLAPEARLTGSVRNVASARLDIGQACLRGAFDYSVSSDGPATLRLSDGRTLSLRKGLNTGRLR